MSSYTEVSQVNADEEAHFVAASEVAQVDTNNKEAAQSIGEAIPSLPPHVVKDLLSIGVCVRCIFRFFGVRGCAYSCLSLLPSDLHHSSVEESKDSHDCSVGFCFKASENLNCVLAFQESEDEPVFCSICLGILQFAYSKEKEMLVKKDSASEFAVSIAELVKQEGHQIESFSLEVSVPPIILANERAIWLYMKTKYGSESWFQEKLLTEHTSVKDALKLSIMDSLGSFLAINNGVSSLRIRLTYTHAKASLNLQNILERDQGCKRRKTGSEDNLVAPGSEFSEQSAREADAVFRRSLDGLPDHLFCERFTLPPERYSRNVSQTRWIIDDERMGQASVEEIIGSNMLPILRGDDYKFHAAGREDIDVRMLGSGRPFLIEVQNARDVPSCVAVKQMEQKINNLEDRLVAVKNLKVVGNQGWTLMREGEAEKQKQYAALVWISRPLEEEDLLTISSFKDMRILQRTPIRVLHRRSPLEREKIIHWMKVEKITGSSQYFLLYLCTQAGTYIKEFVHGDFGRTNPSIGSILGCRAEILQLDVTDVKMDCFLTE
ncbi:tRNA pseudouridine synthase Pus10 isoform X2 [Telopea speciosissima]|uniref:tRNA pseudouridine synthase Pus10 isoform X2 n=1 Tax=Telopea speciosissima TaxID=54955 RepID=UPI001CC3F03D|nr:tRNA pseudouridine synthase Pus10 isoform X2 [Telopea speciosissima]